MTSSTERISSAKREQLRQMAAWTGESMHALLEQAIERYRRELFLAKANEAFAALKGDPAAWDEEIAEREEWQITLGDGLEED